MKFKRDDMVVVVKVTDENFGKTGKILFERIIDGATMYSIKFEDGSLGVNLEAELEFDPSVKEEVTVVAENENDNTQVEANFVPIFSITQDRAASFDRAMYAENMSKDWHTFVLKTNTSGLSEEIHKAYEHALESIGRVIALERKAAI